MMKSSSRTSSNATSSSAAAAPAPALSTSTLLSSSSPSPTSTSSTPSSPTLRFHRQILDDLTQQDGLVILARGLGLPQLLFHLIAQYAATSHLVFVLNLTEDQQRDINDRLTSLPTPTSSPPSSPPHLHLINNAVSAAERQRLYLTGGCFSITNRILIVDLLNKVIAPDLISGLILNAAHRCSDDSTEAFILRIYRQANKHGFLKALSDDPSAFSSGFFGLDKAMKALHLRSLALYPRFHLAVSASLSEEETSTGSSDSPVDHRPSRKPFLDVHEMYQPLTPTMDLIQRALLECMDLCISALKQEHKLGASILNITIDSGLTTAFDTLIRRELDPIWHKVSPRSRQLVADLGSLRQCISYLINYDSVTFYRYLLTVRAQCQASQYSLWLLTEPADRLFKQAKSRVYHFESALTARPPLKSPSESKQGEDVLARARLPLHQLRGTKRKSPVQPRGRGGAKRRGGSRAAIEVVEVEDDEVDEVKAPPETKENKSGETPPPPQDRIRLVLEENPKMNLLADILQEIEDEVGAARGEGSVKKESDGGEDGKVKKEGRVLICCHDERTCGLLQRYLEQGGRVMMRQQWRSFLYRQRQRKSRTSSGPAISSATTTLPSHLPAPSSTNAANPWAVLAAEKAALQRELGKLLTQRQQARLKKFERERRRRLEREVEEKRRADIGADQITLTQHMRGVDEKKRKEEAEVKEAKKKAKAKEKTRKAEQREKQRRLANITPEEDDDDGILRDVLATRDKRERRIENLSDEEDEEEEGEEGEEGEKKRKEDDWGVLSVCDVALHLRSTEADDNSLPSTQASHPPPPPLASVYHQFDETLLHALPSYQLLFHPSQDVDLLMYRYQPDYVIMFDPDLTLLREVEVYAAYHPHLPITVYYCQYVNSVEEQRYLSSIKHEKDAFDQLIFQKQHMVVPSEVEGKSVGLSGGNVSVERTEALRMPKGSLDDGGGVRYNTFEAYQSTLRSAGSSINTRKGGDVSVQVSGKVIVDVREFRSSLPSLLHFRGLTLIPVTLEVGDYVLSQHICVERKSLPDLFSSFLSGRLFKQMEVMTRHYKSPVLLIEFDRKRPFALLSKGELGAELNSRHIMAKLTLLVLHCPQVRFVWSRDSHMTSAMFLMLKHNQAEPDVEGVLSAVGEGVGHLVTVQEMTGEAVGEDEDERVHSMMSFDMLRKLPGVTAANLRLLVENVHTLEELCAKKVTELMLWMGESNARKLYYFLHKDFSSLFT